MSRPDEVANPPYRDGLQMAVVDGARVDAHGLSFAFFVMDGSGAGASIPFAKIGDALRDARAAEVRELSGRPCLVEVNGNTILFKRFLAIGPYA